MTIAFDGSTKQIAWTDLVNFLASILGSPTIQTAINATQAGTQTVDALAQALSNMPPCPGSN